jgi:hypothetical protein
MRGNAVLSFVIMAVLGLVAGCDNVNRQATFDAWAASVCRDDPGSCDAR